MAQPGRPTSTHLGPSQGCRGANSRECIACACVCATRRFHGNFLCVTFSDYFLVLSYG